MSRWQDVLLQRCYDCMKIGGEVRIQFSKRIKENKGFVVPIVKYYPNNQVICEEEEIPIED